MRVGLPVTASLAAHFALFTWTPAPDWDHRKEPAREPVNVTIAWEPVPERRPPPLEDVVDPSPTSPPRRVSLRPAVSAEGVSEGAAPAEAVSAATTGASEAPTERPSSVPMTLDLSPGAVARAAQPADRGPIQAGEIERNMEIALNGSLRDAAGRGHPGTRRPPPELRARVDGSYDFQGHVFSARIAPDGEVTFDDAPNVQLDGSGVSFDITDAIERRLGNDPYAAERRWFLRETEELRDRLASQVWEEGAPRRLARFRAGLIRAWGRRAPVRDRRAALFTAWDECEEDRVGDEARAAVVDFIRDRLPSGSPDAFGASELQELNARRRSRARFAPYAGASDQ